MSIAFASAATYAFQLHHTGIKTYSLSQVEREFFVFQLHHTGIKTRNYDVFYAFEGDDFNCTIQELKQSYSLRTAGLANLFQLHHTGIKTKQTITDDNSRTNFNCTIQELKQVLRVFATCSIFDFNCTIQELKPEKIETLKAATYISIAPYRN